MLDFDTKKLGVEFKLIPRSARSHEIHDTTVEFEEIFIFLEWKEQILTLMKTKGSSLLPPLGNNIAIKYVSATGYKVVIQRDSLKIQEQSWTCMNKQLNFQYYDAYINSYFMRPKTCWIIILLSRLLLILHLSLKLTLDLNSPIISLVSVILVLCLNLCTYVWAHWWFQQLFLQEKKIQKNWWCSLGATIKLCQLIKSLIFTPSWSEGGGFGDILLYLHWKTYFLMKHNLNHEIMR